jgi:hypothetical protein
VAIVIRQSVPWPSAEDNRASLLALGLLHAEMNASPLELRARVERRRLRELQKKESEVRAS